jgi:hypothetical protein
MKLRFLHNISSSRVESPDINNLSRQQVAISKNYLVSHPIVLQNKQNKTLQKTEKEQSWQNVLQNR